MKGKLFVVATPIGNLQDLSPRSAAVLGNVEFAACEDTRTSSKLLAHLGLHPKKISFHENSNPEKVLKILREGKDVALLCDAGTPGISDPGGKLVAAACTENFEICPLPGPSAILGAICASGFRANHFEFLGFVPHKKGRQKFLQNVAGKNHTCICFESPHRILKFLQQASEILPERELCVARELTKIFEEFLRGRPAEILQILEQDPQKQKGEFTICVKGRKFCGKVPPQ